MSGDFEGLQWEDQESLGIIIQCVCAFAVLFSLHVLVSEVQLRRDPSRAKAIAKAIPDPIAICNPNPNPMMPNPAYGYAADQYPQDAGAGTPYTTSSVSAVPPVPSSFLQGDGVGSSGMAMANAYMENNQEPENYSAWVKYH